MYRKIILAVAIFIGVKSGELAGAAQAAQLRQAASQLGRRGFSSAPRIMPKSPATNPVDVSRDQGPLRKLLNEHKLKNQDINERERVQELVDKYKLKNQEIKSQNGPELGTSNSHGESVQLVPWQNPKNSLQLVPQQNPKSGSNGVPLSVWAAGAIVAPIITSVGIGATRSAIEEDRSRNSDGSVNISHMERYHSEKGYNSARLLKALSFGSMFRAAGGGISLEFLLMVEIPLWYLTIAGLISSCAYHDHKETYYEKLQKAAEQGAAKK